MTDAPKGWVAGPLRKFAPLQRGFDLPTTKVVPGDFPVVYSNGIGRFHNKAMLNGPGVVTGRSGTIGRVHFVDRDYWPHNTALWVTDFKTCAPKFVYYLLQSVGLERFAGGSGVPTLNRNDAHAFEICVPASRQEQVRIAEALTEADDLIAALERLIAKKQAIKQGMMQQLLTGRTRLPGFTEPWGEQASFEDLCTRSTGFWGASDSTASSPNRVRVITAGDITPEGHLKGAATRYFSNAQVAKARCMTDDLVVTSSGNGLGKTAYIDEPGTLAASNFVRILRPRKGVSGSFLAQIMRTPSARDVLNSNTATSAYPNLLPGFFTERWIPRPPSDEQLAIAGVLQDADAEITALRARVNKARAVKTGMMQQLLAGRVRLQGEAAP